MNELKAFDIVVAEEGYCEGIVKYRRAVYDKAEADKVIADLEESHKMEVEQLLMEIVKLKEGAKNLILDNYLKDKEARHSKYKRCLAMAKWCERKRIDAADYRIPRKKWDFYDKWHKCWLKIAERFK